MKSNLHFNPTFIVALARTCQGPILRSFIAKGGFWLHEIARKPFRQKRQNQIQSPIPHPQ
jgi:hypothetical protein